MSVTTNDDPIFLEKQNNMKSTVAFLRAIKKHLEAEQAALIVNEAAANYLIAVYEDVLKGTIPGKKDRFNAFRNYYEKYSDACAYCEVLVSKDDFLKVKYGRCPNAEILKSLNLFEFATASCLSDKVMTEILLPGVEFNRESSIVAGQDVCIMSWSYRDNKTQQRS